MSSLTDKNGVEITNSQKIRENVHNFYRTLYSSHENNVQNADLDVILQSDTPKLNDHDAESIEGKITITEASIALKNMKNNKSPGSSGFTVEFFKFFWKDLGIFLVNSINYGFDRNEMSTTQKEGIITCIPKGNKSKKIIKNWRPISLLNVSYKIASSCIATRIKKVLPLIIDFDQSGFMAGRFSSDNIRLLYDVLFLSRELKKPGLLLLIDFEKAFDSIASSFIFKALKFMNFKSDIINWIKTFTNNIKSSVIVNNSPTNWFSVERGCRQGDPISPYIFLICAEILAHMIRQNENIKGYSLFNVEIKISSYADDTSLFLDGSQESFEYCVHTILEYAKYSGLAMNFDKTKVIWFGCEETLNTRYLEHIKFEWNPETFNVLGIDFTTNLNDITDINIRKKLLEIKQTINQWSKRDLTPYGKTTVVKTLLLSKIVHILLALPSPSIKLIKEIQKMIYSFLWNDKPDQIKRHIAQQKPINGGLGITDLHSFDQALKLTWISKLENSCAKWKKLATYSYPELLTMKNFGEEFLKMLQNKLKNEFWTNVVNALYSLSNKYEIKTQQEFDSTSFLFNKNFKVGKNCIQNQLLIENNIHFIYQLKIENRFLSYDEFTNKFNIRLNYLHFNSIICSIKRTQTKLQLEQEKKHYMFQPPLQIIMSTKKGASKIYQKLIYTDYASKGLMKWQNITGINKQFWEKSFYQLFETINDTKLRYLQFRILHYTLTTNRSVSKFKPNQTDKCEFCQNDSETIQHLMWHCEITQYFWKKLEFFLKAQCEHLQNLYFNEELILFGTSEKMKIDQICSLIILTAKFFIYRCKVQKINPIIKLFKQELNKRYEMEKFNHSDSARFKDSWRPYINLFRSLTV